MSHYDEERAEPEKGAELKAILEAMAQTRRERLAMVEPAKEALRRLVKCCEGRSGQSYKLRALLWSLYNGKRVALNECLGLDWSLRKDFGAVFLAFGFEHKTAGSFFYQELKAAFSSAGLLDWFEEESEIEEGEP